jgi:hypothetical protein
MLRQASSGCEATLRRLPACAKLTILKSAFEVRVGCCEGRPAEAFAELNLQREKPMSKHDKLTKRNRRPKSAKRIDYTRGTMAELKKLAEAAKLHESAKVTSKSA